MRSCLNLLALVILLASCKTAPSAIVTPTQNEIPTIPAQPSATIHPTNIPTGLLPTDPPPTGTPTVAPTLIPTVAGLSVDVSDPYLIHPQFFDLSQKNAPIPRFVAAMKMIGIELLPDEVLGNLKYVDKRYDGAPLADKQGNPVVVIVYENADILYGHQIPFFIATERDGAWNWNAISFRKLGEQIGIELGAYLGDTTALDEMSTGTIMFSWSSRQTSPEGKVNFSLVDGHIRNGKEKNLNSFTFSHLLFPANYPDWVLAIQSEEELIAIIKNYFKTIMTYGVSKGVTRFDVYNEPYLLPDRPDYIFSLLHKNITANQVLEEPYLPIVKMFEIAHETAQEIKADQPGAIIKLGFANGSSHYPEGYSVSQNHEVLKALAERNLVDYINVHAGVTDLDTILDYQEEDIQKLLKSYAIQRADGEVIDVFIGEFLLSLKKETGLPETEQFTRQMLAADKFMSASLKARVVRFSFWGMKDGETDGIKSHPFDGLSQPKPFYYGITSSLLRYWLGKTD